MNRVTRFSHAIMIGFLGLCVLTTLGCSDDEVEMVTIVGMVANIDTGEPADDVVVFLLDHEDEYASKPTGADGRFFFEVPLGSPNLLVTNDWAGLDKDTPPGSTIKDDWLTFINIDPMVPVLDSDMELLIHDCPTSGSPKTWLGGLDSTGAPNGLGSAAVWENFLLNSEMAPDYTDVTDLNGKIVVFMQVGTPWNNELGIPVANITGISVGVQESDFGEVGYWSVLNVFNLEIPGLEGSGVQDISKGPDIFIPGATENGPGMSLVTVFGRTTYLDEIITLTFVDARPERNIDFSEISPLKIPIRTGATTFVAAGAVDNVVSPLLDGFCSAGLSPLPCEGQGEPEIRDRPGVLRP